MKIAKFTSLAEAELEADRLVTALNLPPSYRYGSPFQIDDGTWVLKVKENGSFPATEAIQGVIEEYEYPDPD
jgi:hypothetical protein